MIAIHREQRRKEKCGNHFLPQAIALLCLAPFRSFHFKPSIPIAIMTRIPVVVVLTSTILVLSCIFLLTTTSKALYSCAISGGIQFSYHRDYMTMTFSTSFSIMALASNDGQEKQSIARRSKKPGKIVTPEAIEEKEQERLN